MIILTYFFSYSFLGNTQIIQSMGGLPLINCVTGLITDGFSPAVMAALTKDFAQTIIVVYIVVFVQNLLPENNSRGIGAVIGIIVGYIILYLIGIWIVRYIIFTDRMSEIIQMFIAVFSVVFAGLGAVLSSPIRRIITQRMASNYLRDYLLNSRIIHWLADSFFITTVILFLAVAIEMTVGLPYFFTAVVVGAPSIITMIIMVALLYFMIRL